MLRLKRLTRIALSALAPVLIATAAPAQAAYPERPVTVIVAWTAGGATDLLTRGIQDAFQKALGGQVVVKNVPGAAGTLGTAEAARSAPDGYTILVSPIGPITLQPHRMKLDYSYDSFETVCKLVDSPVVLMAAPNSKYKNVAEVVAAAKAAPGKVPYGSTGPGTIPHASMIAFAKAAGIDIKHVPYKGSADVVQGLLTNTVDLFTDQPNLVPQYNLTALGIFASNRIPTYKDIPTLKEAGYDLQFSIWNSMFAPKGTPEPIMAKLEAACRTALADQGVIENLGRQRQPIDFLDRKGASAFIAAEFKKNGELLSEAGLKVK
ncbi:MAG: tripartite tricarboxylate transporter substrate binding protein [Hyphomicrobium sp.]|nr:tripartite tricarboxylate transporter substrate binding protein [Hyphomicrobium sp.]